MYRAIGKLRSDKRGFTLVELLVVLAIMGLAIGLVAELIATVYKNYLIVEDRFIIQSEVQYVMSLFELGSNKESITSAYEAALFYDESFDKLSPNAAGDGYEYSGAEIFEWDDTYEVYRYKQDSFPAANSIPELGAYHLIIEEDSSSHKETLVGIQFEKGAENEKYTYLFGVGGYLFVLNPKKDTAQRARMEKSDLSTPISLYFEVSKSVNELVTENEGDTQWFEKETDSEQFYNTDGIHVVVSGDFSRISDNDRNPIKHHNISNKFKYSLDASFALRNFVKDNAKLNVVGTDADGDYILPNAYVAGYTDLALNTQTGMGKELYKAIGETCTGDGYTKVANVFRYESATTFEAKQGDANAAGFNDMYYKCAARGAMDGSMFEEPVIDTLHNFRDDVLKGTAVGDWFIDKYYNVISPALVQLEAKSDLFRYAVRAVLIPTAKVLSLIS